MAQSLIDEILEDGVEEFVRVAVRDFLAKEVKAGVIPADKAAYITEGAVDAVNLGFKMWQSSKKD